MISKKKYARIFDRDDFPAPKYKKLVSGGYILHHIKSLDNSFFGIGLLVKFVTRQSLRKKKNNNNNNLVPRVFPPLSEGKPEDVEVNQYSCLDVTSILFIDTCLPSLFKSWLCGPVKWSTEETTNQFKSNAGSYLRVNNRSIGRERERKSFPSGVESQQTYLTQVSMAK